MSEEARGWQPIETAPRDGTRVLLWVSPHGFAAPFAWQDGVWMGDDYPLNMAWPTHWMPLPAPPNSEQDGSTPKDSLRDQLRVARDALEKRRYPAGNRVMSYEIGYVDGWDNAIDLALSLLPKEQR